MEIALPKYSETLKPRYYTSSCDRNILKQVTDPMWSVSWKIKVSISRERVLIFKRILIFLLQYVLVEFKILNVII